MLVHDTDTTERIIGCAMTVHKTFGPGLLESSYEAALGIELEASGLSFARQIRIPLYYRGQLIGEHRPDLIVGDRVIVEIKCVEKLAAIHVAQLTAYLRVAKLKVGLLLNFNAVLLRHGIRRVVL